MSLTFASESDVASSAAHHAQLWREETVDLDGERAHRRRATRRRLLTGAVGLAAAVLAWQLAATVLNDSVILPSVWQTLRSLAHYFTHGYPSQSPPLWRDLIISLRRVAVGFLGGTVI